MRRKFRCRAAGALALAAVLPLSAQISASVKKDAERVLIALERIEAESLSKPRKSLERADFSEAELNAYIAYRIAAEPEGVLKVLVLKLLGENKVEGKAFLDLSGASLPLGLKPRMNLYFSGRVASRAGTVHLEFENLFLEDRAVPLMLLDMIILAAAAIGKSDSGSIRDWYELPYGIKEIRTAPEKLSLYYSP